jgi:hypothetical protein
MGDAVMVRGWSADGPRGSSARNGKKENATRRREEHEERHEGSDRVTATTDGWGGTANQTGSRR